MDVCIRRLGAVVFPRVNDKAIVGMNISLRIVSTGYFLCARDLPTLLYLRHGNLSQGPRSDFFAPGGRDVADGMTEGEGAMQNSSDGLLRFVPSGYLWTAWPPTNG